MNVLRKIDGFLNGITMYRLVLYGLMIIAAGGLLSSAVGTLALPLSGLAISLALAGSVCFVSSWTLSKLYNIPANDESWLISALILFCILPPVSSLTRALAVVVASLVAIAPRYVFAIRGKHVFNPAAAGAFTVAVLGMAYATWWVGSPVMLPFTLIVGLLVVRKIRRFTMVSVFMLLVLAGFALFATLHDQAVGTFLKQAIVSGPLIFFASIMLVEPSTIPPRLKTQLVYVAIVAGVLSLHMHWWVFSTSPETALMVGNAFAYFVSPKYRMRLKLVKKTQLSARVYDFAFEPNIRPTFLPGQYMEWTLPMEQHDLRGNRRTFTIASSPTEKYLHIGVKFYDPSSAYKKTLKELKTGDLLFAGQIAGDFTLLPDTSKKLVFVAGGIGITPFRSMLAYLVSRQEKRDVVLLYMISDPAEFSYGEVFDKAKSLGVRVVPVLGAQTIPASWKGKTGFLTEELVREVVPDFATRVFYFSGPNAMVENYVQLMRHMGLPRKQIKTDRFSGY